MFSGRLCHLSKVQYLLPSNASETTLNYPGEIVYVVHNGYPTGKFKQERPCRGGARRFDSFSRLSPSVLGKTLNYLGKKFRLLPVFGARVAPDAWLYEWVQSLVRRQRC